MSFNKSLTACVITFLLVLSIFTVPLTQNVKAEDDFFDIDTDIMLEMLQYLGMFKQLMDFDDITSPHPFRFTGIWHSNSSMTINGSMTFDLYFSSPLTTQIGLLGLQDSVKVSVYHRDNSGLITKLQDAEKTITLEPEILSEFIQSYQITLDIVDLEVDKNDELFFVIELIHSEKPIEDIAAKRFPKLYTRMEKILTSIEKLENIISPILDMNNTDFENIISQIETALEAFSSSDIGASEVGELMNTVFSSAFFYGSTDHPSKVSFSSEENNHTLYFHNEADTSFESILSELSDYGYIKIVNATAPSTNDDHAYPPVVFFNDELELNDVSKEEIISWLVLAFLYVYEAPESFENRVTYYLHSGDLMDSNKPDDFEHEREKISETLSWSGSSFERNKILKNVTADLYIYYPQLITLKKTVIVANLKQGEEIIATSETEIDRTSIMDTLKRNAQFPTTFNFDIVSGNEEIWHDQDLTLELSVSDSPSSLLKSPIISYDSLQYPSEITIGYAETNNIKIDDMEDREIYAGETIEYILNVTSEYDDTIVIDVEELSAIGDWEYSISPEEFDIDEGETQEVILTVESKATDDSAYEDEDFIQLAVSLSGDTGYSEYETNIFVLESAVEYGIEVISPEDVEIKHGDDGKLIFTIINKNKGFISDRYTFDITSEHGWKISYKPYVEEYIDVGEEAKINATYSVPWYTDVETDKITIEITSAASEKYDTFTKVVMINVTIGTPNILDSIYQLFENAAKAIGLDNFSENYSGWLLIGLLIMILLIILLILIFLRRRKYVEFTCPERIKEIDVDETAVYTITIKNTYKSVLTYDIKTEIDEDAQKRWDVTIDTLQMMLEPGKERVITLSVKPNDYIKKEDWVEAKVIVKPIDKNKKAVLSTVTSIRKSKVDVKIAGVFHWPRIFKQGDRVETSFKLFNRGNVSAENISVILYVNGEEKNKVENITIPRGGHADINIPWIAVKGKNEVYIVVK